MRLVWDGTMFMRNALKEITKTLSETILIVALVVFLQSHPNSFGGNIPHACLGRGGRLIKHGSTFCEGDEGIAVRGEGQGTETLFVVAQD